MTTTFTRKGPQSAGGVIAKREASFRATIQAQQAVIKQKNEQIVALRLALKRSYEKVKAHDDAESDDAKP